MKSGVLIDKIIRADHEYQYLNGECATDVKIYIQKPKRYGQKWPYMTFCRKILGCIRILRGKGMVVYYKEDE